MIARADARFAWAEVSAALGVARALGARNSTDYQEPRVPYVFPNRLNQRDKPQQTRLESQVLPCSGADS